MSRSSKTRVPPRDSTASDLVFVTGADSTRRRTNGDAILTRFRHLLDEPMKRKNDMGAIADAELARDGNPGCLERFHLLEQRGKVDDHAVPDYRGNPRPQYPARD